MTAPEPPNAIPDFLLEQFTDLSPETLRGIADYARGDTYIAPDKAPETIVESFALQDDDTLEAVAEYADSLAAFLETRDAESLTAVTSTQDTQERWGHDNILKWHGN
ncbi:hypothetical protein [Natronorubrum thiooxidans]|uniref:Uncharacterized protein n=1 Tax=Natronorubrum thiooxidans TaxID=308853 RepID=A0A1N7EV35_9EURY|nr:hypothetical protein [Natronorubrum thiooxidans]SIR91919.1 hypothetical protein SAMN05421752_10578 [Natronorubrum thiooxidans]